MSSGNASHARYPPIYIVRVIAITIGVGLASAASYAQSPSPWACNVPLLPVAGTRIVNVSSEPQLQAAMGNLQAGDTVLIADGTYRLSSTLYINGKDNVTIRGTSGCDGVALVGLGMDNASYGTVGIRYLE
jgi:hypothetical protein